MQRRRWVPVVVSMLAVAALAGCSSSSDDTDADADADGSSATTATTAAPTTSAAPEPLDDQRPPAAINGLVVDGSTLWIASITADEVVQVDRTTGAILARFATDGAQPDDVAVGPDGTVWVTGFGNGDVGRIRDGSYEVVTTTAEGVNPVDVAADGTVYVATWGQGGTLWTIDPASGEATVVAEDLPDVNAFVVQPDGTVLAPAGGLTGPGSVVRIDPADGSVTTVVEGLPPVLASSADPDGRLIVLANTTGELFEIDADAGTATSVGEVAGGPFDNLAHAPDGTLYLSSFTAPTVVVVSPDGTISSLDIGA